MPSREIHNALSALHDGDLVEFTYVQQSGNGRWYRWDATAVFLNRQTDDYTDKVVVSFRPKSLTSYMDTHTIQGIKLVTAFQDRKTHREDPNVKLPRRFPGAVPAP